MIGALSIVRFRNPVKSPLELVIFFGLLTMGIAAGVSVDYCVLLLAIMLVVIFGMYFLEEIAKKSGINIFSLSFDEGSALQFMEVVTTEPIKAFQSDAALQQYYYCKSDGTHSYRLAFRRRTDLDALVSEYEFDNRVQNLEARYCSVGL